MPMATYGSTLEIWARWTMKAFIVLKDGYTPSLEMEEELRAYCRKHIAKYALPAEYEFRPSLPTTLVGKVAYTKLEDEEAAKAV